MKTITKCKELDAIIEMKKKCAVIDSKLRAARKEFSELSQRARSLTEKQAKTDNFDNYKKLGRESAEIKVKVIRKAKEIEEMQEEYGSLHAELGKAKEMYRNKVLPEIEPLYPEIKKHMDAIKCYLK